MGSKYDRLPKESLEDYTDRIRSLDLKDKYNELYKTLPEYTPGEDGQEYSDKVESWNDMNSKNLDQLDYEEQKKEFSQGKNENPLVKPQNTRWARIRKLFK